MSLFTHRAWRLFVFEMVYIACVAAAFVGTGLACHNDILHNVRTYASLIKNYFLELLPFHGAQP